MATTNATRQHRNHTNLPLPPNTTTRLIQLASDAITNARTPDLHTQINQFRTDLMPSCRILDALATEYTHAREHPQPTHAQFQARQLLANLLTQDRQISARILQLIHQYITWTTARLQSLNPAAANTSGNPSTGNTRTGATLVAEGFLHQDLRNLSRTAAQMEGVWNAKYRNLNWRDFLPGAGSSTTTITNSAGSNSTSPSTLTSTPAQPAAPAAGILKRPDPFFSPSSTYPSASTHAPKRPRINPTQPIGRHYHPLRMQQRQQQQQQRAHQQQTLRKQKSAQSAQSTKSTQQQQTLRRPNPANIATSILRLTDAFPATIPKLNGEVEGCVPREVVEIEDDDDEGLGEGDMSRVVEEGSGEGEVLGKGGEGKMETRDQEKKQGQLQQAKEKGSGMEKERERGVSIEQHQQQQQQQTPSTTPTASTPTTSQSSSPNSNHKSLNQSQQPQQTNQTPNLPLSHRQHGLLMAGKSWWESRPCVSSPQGQTQVQPQVQPQPNQKAGEGSEEAAAGKQ